MMQATGPILTRTALLNRVSSIGYDGGLLQPIHFTGTNQAAANSAIAMVDDGAGTSSPSFRAVGGPTTDPCPTCADPSTP